MAGKRPKDHGIACSSSSCLLNYRDDALRCICRRLHTLSLYMCDVAELPAFLGKMVSLRTIECTTCWRVRCKGLLAYILFPFLAAVCRLPSATHDDNMFQHDA